MTELIAAPAGQRRVALLIKAKIAHQAGYYLLNGRWHSIHQHKPAPKGVPVAAHPKAAHAEHVKPFPLPDEQIEALKLPPENVNSGTYNKQLDSLLGYAANGDATAILGMNLGTNTYGKKLAKVANYLLQGMGVTEEYQVAPGQKAGEHHAVKQTPAPVETPAPAANEPVIAAAAVIEAAKADDPVVEAVVETPAAPFMAYPSSGPLAMPEFVEGKTTTGVVDYYQTQAMKVIDMAESGDLDGLVQMKQSGMVPNSKGKISNTWAGKTENSKKLIALHDNAVELTVENALDALPPAAAVAEPEPVVVEAQVVAAPVVSTDLTSQIPWEKLSSPETKGDGSPNKEGINANKKLAAIKAAAEAGDIATLEGMKFGINTYGKKLNQAKAIALASLEEIPAAPEPVSVVTEPVTPPPNTLAMQLADAKGPLGKMAVAEQHVVKNGKSPETYKQIAEAHEDLGNADSAEHWNAKAADLATMNVLSGAMAADGTVNGSTKIAVAHILNSADSLKAQAQAIDALNELGHTGASKAIQMAMDATLLDTFKTNVSASDEEHEAMAVAKDYLATGGPSAAKVDHIISTLEENGFTTGAQEYKEAYGLDEGPNDGDTKQGADGQLVFQNGRWHKVKTDEAEAAPVPLSAIEHQAVMGYLNSAEADELEHAAGKAIFQTLSEEEKQALNVEALNSKPKAELHPLDAIPLPDLSQQLTQAGVDKVMAGLEKLKENAKTEGASAFKGTLKKMSASGKLITKLPGKYGKLSLKVVGLANSPEHYGSLVHQYVEDLKTVAGGKNVKPKPAPAPAPTPQPYGQPPIESMDNWKQVGPQGGSNPGGKFVDEAGVEWYCKFPKSEDIAKSEVLASKLYGAAGIEGQDAKLITKDGKIGIASKWADVTKAPAATLAKADGAAAGFAVDAWLGNWDVVGLEYDNLQLDPSGKAVRVDAGGSLEYRAQGGKKTFGDTVLEIDSLRDSKINPQAAKVFGKLSQADITASVAKVLKVSDSQIYSMVNAYGPGTPEDKKKLAETLIARKADLLAKYPKAKKTKVITFKPEKISEPPSFMSWGSSGAPGPSSKLFLNEANEAAVQAIYAAAKTGSAEAVKALSADTFNKNTGEVIGSAPVLDHPSQHVKGYAQQALNEIHHQMNPPKRFRFEGGHPLHSLNSAYPSHKGPPHSDAVEKVGKFLMLGSPGIVSLDALALPKITHASGKLTKATYSPAAQAALKQMPETQKQAIKAYTGSAYSNMNSSLWTGNPSGAAKSAGEALHALGHEIAPGTVLSRKLSVQGAALDQILKSAGKVLQEPAIMSTSIRPSSWSGNVHLKLHVGPGVKGLWVGPGSTGGKGALSLNSGEDELILPPNTRLLIMSVKHAGGGDSDGFGTGSSHIVEAVILPTQQAAS